MPVAAWRHLAEESTCLSSKNRREIPWAVIPAETELHLEMLFMTDVYVCMQRKACTCLYCSGEQDSNHGNCKGECSSQGKGVHSRQKSLRYLLFEPTCSSEKTSAYENRVWIAGNGKNYFSSQDENTWEQTGHKTSKTVLEASTLEQISQLPL